MKTRKYKHRRKETRKYSILKRPIVKHETKQLWVRSKLRGKEYTPNWKLHTGGHTGSHTGGVQKSIYVLGYSFVYDETEQQILCLSKDKISACFKIDFDESVGSIGISIGYFPSCSINKDLPESSGTLIMMKAILTLIFQHPNINNYTNIEINDTSHILVTSFEDGIKYKTRLMDMYFLATGCTWYSSLVPMFLKSKQDDDNYLLWRTNILSTKWVDFLNTMISSKMPIDIETRKHYFEFKEQPKDALAHEVLNEIRKDRTHSIIFYKFIDHMLVWMSVLPLYGKPWIIPIRRGKVVCPTEGPIPSCRNEKGWGLPESLIEYIPNAEYDRIKSDLQTKFVESEGFEDIRKEGRVYNPSKAPVNEIEFSNVENNENNTLNTMLYKFRV